MPVVLGYWGLRGLAAPIRYLLEHVGEQYEYKNWSEVPEPGWFGEKQKLGLEFPNLPYLIDGNVKLAQSYAILKYLGRKHNLIATEEKNIQQQDVLEGILGDLRVRWGMFCYTAQNFEDDKKKLHDEAFVPILKQLDQHLAGKTYLIADKLNWLDFAYFELFDVANKLFDGKLLDQFPNLKKHHQTVANLKGVKEFLASGKNFEKINGPMAKWGG